MKEGVFKNGTLGNWRLLHPLIPEWQIETTFQGERKLRNELCNPLGCAATNYFYEGDEFKGFRGHDVLGRLVTEGDAEFRREYHWGGDGLLNAVDIFRGDTKIRRLELDGFGNMFVTYYE